MLPPPIRHRLGLAAACALLAAALVSAAQATPVDFIPVGDPLEDEMRVLDILGRASHGGRVTLPHLHMRPLQVVELVGSDAGPVVPAAEISIARLERFVARDTLPAARSQPVPGLTPRLVQLRYPGDERFEISGGLEGRGTVDRDDSRFISGSGLHARIAAGTESWLLYSHLYFGHVDSARTFADPVVPNNDVIVYTEESYLAYTGASRRWALQLGRSRWHWGPGQEGSLILSKTSAALTGLAMHVRIPSLAADAIALSATLDAAAGEQLAAHRLEWQPTDGLRLGVSEAARYRADRWEPLYLIGVIPYSLVQRIYDQDSPDSASALRNNVLFGLDAAWRLAPGTRLYGELAIDDLHSHGSSNPDKYGWQAGLEGAGTVAGTRLAWGTEITRLSPFMYTSYFGRSFASQAHPLGFPTGPDSRRVRVRGSLDLSSAWQLTTVVVQTDQGESGLDSPYVPGSPKPDPDAFVGVVERTREVDLGVRFWPASGLDIVAEAGYGWTENSGHAAGADREGPRGALSVRLIR